MDVGDEGGGKMPVSDLGTQVDGEVIPRWGARGAAGWGKREAQYDADWMWGACEAPNRGSLGEAEHMDRMVKTSQCCPG